MDVWVTSDEPEFGAEVADKIQDHIEEKTGEVVGDVCLLHSGECFPICEKREHAHESFTYGIGNAVGGIEGVKEKEDDKEDCRYS